MEKEMTYLEKIRKFTSRVNAIGGAHVWPRFGSLQMAFGHGSSNMFLYDVDFSDAHFCERERGSENADLEKVWRMPLAWLSEFILRQIFIELKFAARFTLDTNTYNELMDMLGEEQ